jgi:hypothetical protein
MDTTGQARPRKRQSALYAGIRLAFPIDGVGRNAIEEALCAIADALGVKDYALTHAHA